MNEKNLVLDLMEDLLTETEDEIMLFKEHTVSIPQYVKNAAKKGLEIRDKQPDSNKCCTKVGLMRANQLINDENLSLKTLKRMKSFASRHGAQVDWRSPDINSKQAQSILLWGSPYSQKGLEKFIKWVDREIEKYEKAKGK